MFHKLKYICFKLINKLHNTKIQNSEFNIDIACFCFKHCYQMC